MPPPMDLGQKFNQLVQMISKDMQQVGENIKQIVAKVTQQDQRLARLEQLLQQHPMNGVSHGNTQVVQGQVMPAPGVTAAVPDGTPIWKGDPDAFYKGDEDA